MLRIKTYPDNTLRKKSKIITEITDRERELFDQMLLTMKQACGIGLAAPQIGINQRIIVVDIGEGPIKLANPEIVSVKGRDRMEEGCLSVPAAQVNVIRPYELVLKAINEKGQDTELKARGLLARVLLHEIDHLNGKLIVDYMNLLQKVTYKMKVRR